MPRGKRNDARVNKRDHAPTDPPPATLESGDAPATNTPDLLENADGPHAEAHALSAFFRELATRAEHDPDFGAGLLSVAHASGLARLTGQSDLDAQDAATSGHASVAPPDEASAAPSEASAQFKGKRGRQQRATASAPADTKPDSQPAPDPFAVLRAKGADGLRATLDALDLPTLRQIVRAHRLDPARISARWANRERVISLIVDQTRARLNHGRAFERV